MGSNLGFVELGTGRTATAIAAASNYTCAILDNASVKCWGRNSQGQLGLGNNTELGDNANEMGDNLPIVDLGTGRTATAIAAGQSHTCVILDNASVKCWGSASEGRLGLGNTNNMGDGANEMGDNLPTVDLGTGRTAIAIAAGPSHNCAILDNASVKCWGYGMSGRLGIGNGNNMGDGANEMGDNLPTVDLGTGRTATAIAAGGDGHSCAILDNASVKCWGRNYYGSLGLNAGWTDSSSSNLGDGANEMGDNLSSIDLGTAISSKGNHICVILDNASVKCWGGGQNGVLGSGSTDHLGNGANEMGDNLSAVNLGTGRTATAISVGDESTCALLDNAAVKCWGRGWGGKLGQGNTNSLGDNANEMGDNLPAIDL
jgi:alpha-tubulin suppressor-like RCC1 family protein